MRAPLLNDGFFRGLDVRGGDGHRAVGDIASGALVREGVDEPGMARAEVVDARHGLGLEALPGLVGVLRAELAHLSLGEGREGDVLDGDVEGRRAAQPGHPAAIIVHHVVAHRAHADEHHAPRRGLSVSREVERAELREERHHRRPREHVGLVEQQHQRTVARPAERRDVSLHGELGHREHLGAPLCVGHSKPGLCGDRVKHADHRHEGAGGVVDAACGLKVDPQRAVGALRREGLGQVLHHRGLAGLPPRDQREPAALRDERRGLDRAARGRDHVVLLREARAGDVEPAGHKSHWICTLWVHASSAVRAAHGAFTTPW